MSTSPPTTVHAAGDPTNGPLIRIEADSVDGLVAAIRSVDDRTNVLAVLDTAVSSEGDDDHEAVFDVDELVAVVSVLVVEGVQHFETSKPQPVQRILDTFRAITHGTIDSINP